MFWTGQGGVIIHQRNSYTEAPQPPLLRMACLIILAPLVRRKSKRVPTPAEIGCLGRSVFLKTVFVTAKGRQGMEQVTLG